MVTISCSSVLGVLWKPRQLEPNISTHRHSLCAPPPPRLPRGVPPPPPPLPRVATLARERVEVAEARGAGRSSRLFQQMEVCLKKGVDKIKDQSIVKVSTVDTF